MRRLEESLFEREQRLCPLPYPVSVGAERRLLRGPRYAWNSMPSVFRGGKKPGHVFSKRSSRDAIALRARGAVYHPSGIYLSGDCSQSHFSFLATQRSLYHDRG